MREAVEMKGRRYLTEGRLTITYVRHGSARAICRGKDAVYTIALDGDQWSCSCPARRRCSHIMAAQRVIFSGPSEALTTA